MKFSVSAVIPNYNGKKLLEKNLPSVIAALKFSCENYEIIVSDDDSEDDSVRFLKNNYPEIKFSISGKNCGFSVAANRGIQLAEKQLTLLLNSDVKLSENYLEKQFRYFEKPNTFGVMGSICSPDGKLIDAAKYPQWNGFQIKSTLNFFLKNPSENFLIPTYFLSGANALMDTKKLKLLNGFDEIFSPFYMEDVELSMRAWRMGWNCFYEPKAVCFHNISRTINKHNSAKKIKIISKRNKFIFHAIHLDKNTKFLWKIEVFFSLLFRWLTFDFNYYKSYFNFLKMENKIKFSREKFVALKPKKTIFEIINEIQKSVNNFEKDLF